MCSYTYRSPARIAAAGVAAVVLAACASRRAPPAATGPGAIAPARAGIPLRVENHHHGDVTVFVVRGGIRQRLGLVTAATTTRFTIPSRFAADGAGFALLARAVGGTTSTRSDNVVPQSRQLVVWTLESDLGRSMLAIEENATP